MSEPFSKHLGAMLGKGSVEHPTPKIDDLEMRLDKYTRIAERVNELARGNPYGALHLVESLQDEERTPALYGIVLHHTAQDIAELAVKDPEKFEQVRKTEAYRLFEQLSAYCASKADYLGGAKEATNNAPKGTASYQGMP